MKKVIISIIILLICAGVAGYFGLVHIPPDLYGIIHTTLRGFDTEVYEPETYLWRWEKLLPTVFSLYTFNLSPYRADISSPIKGSLYPSGNDYAKALGEDFDFSFDISLSVEFAINPDSLLELAENGLRPDTLPVWYQEISYKLSEALSSIIINDPEIFITMTRKEALEKIQVILSDNKDFMGIQLLAVDPKNINIPDYDAYAMIKEKYFAHLEEWSSMKKEIMDAEKSLYLAAIEKEIDIIRNIEKYGDILTTYPAILDYLHKTNKEYVKDALDVIEE
jgi:hypothetical protein